MELNIGILAASLPALRPLFTWMFETAKTFNNTRFGTRRHGGYTRNNEDTVKLSSMPSRSDTLSSNGGKEEYKVSVTSGQGGGALTSHSPLGRKLSLKKGSKENNAPKSRLEKTIAEEDAWSDEERDITVGIALSGQKDRSQEPGGNRVDGFWGNASAGGGIMRTTEVYVSR